MVEWLLHNSLGQMWLVICQAQGWTVEVQADGTLDHLEERPAKADEWELMQIEPCLGCPSRGNSGNPAEAEARHYRTS